MLVKLPPAHVPCPKAVEGNMDDDGSEDDNKDEKGEEEEESGEGRKRRGGQMVKQTHQSAGCYDLLLLLSYDLY